MSLIRCVACGADVSSEAAACPKCGQPTPRAKATPPAWRVVALLVLGAAGLVAFARWAGLF